MNDIVFDHELDCKGLNCPLPILKTNKQITSMSSGEVLKMIATDPGSINDMNSWARQTGNELLNHLENDGEYIFHIRKV